MDAVQVVAFEGSASKLNTFHRDANKMHTKASVLASTRAGLYRLAQGVDSISLFTSDRQGQS